MYTQLEPGQPVYLKGWILTIALRTNFHGTNALLTFNFTNANVKI